MTSGSPEAFLKRLKSTNNAALALSAWNDKDFYLPSKGQHLTAWALDHLLKVPVAVQNVRVWRVLDAVLLGTTSSSPQWLSSVLYKTPIVPILASLLRLGPSEKPGKEAQEVVEVSRRVMEILLPMAYPRTRFETVLDCLWAVFESLSHSKGSKDMKYHQIVALNGFQAAFTNATNKGKVYSIFIQNHFNSWVEALEASQSVADLEKELWQSGCDILTSVDALKLLYHSETKAQESYFECLKASTKSMPFTLDVAPRIFREQATATKVHRVQLVNMKLDPSNSRLFSSYVAIYIDCADDQQAQALLDHMRVIETTMDVSTRDQEWKVVLMHVRDTAFARLASQSSSSNQAKYLDIVTIIGRMDYNLLLPHVVLILRLMASYTGSTQSCANLFQVLIDYHSRTRTLDQLCQALLEAAISLQETSSFKEDQDSRDGVKDILNGPLYGIQGGKALFKAVNLTLTPGQVPTLTDYCVSRLCESLNSLKTILDAKTPQEDASRNAALAATYICRASSFILPHLPDSNLSWTRLDMEIIGRRLQNDFILSGLQICLQSKDSASWGCQVFGASILHLVSLLNRMDSWITLRVPYERVIPYVATSLLSSEARILTDLRLEAARILCRAGSLDVTRDAFQHILNNMDCAPNASWNGKSTGISSEGLSCAYWCLLSTQELQNFASRATTEQHKQFSELIFSRYDPSIQHSQSLDITPSSSVDRLLKSASFWECAPIHEQLFFTILPTTALLDQVNIENLGEMWLSPEEFSSIFRSFAIILALPSEVVRPHAGVLAKRAILADVAVSTLETSSAPTLTSMRTVFRTFASRRIRDHNPTFRGFMSTWTVINSLYRSIQTTFIQDESFCRSTTLLLDSGYRSLLGTGKVSHDDLRQTGKMIGLDSKRIGILTSLHLECLAIILFALGDCIKNSKPDNSILREASSLASPIASMSRVNVFKSSSGVKVLRASLYVQRMAFPSDDDQFPLYEGLYNSIFKSTQGTSDAEETVVQCLWMLSDILEGVPKLSKSHNTFLAGYLLAAQRSSDWSRLDQPLHKLSRSLAPDTYDSFIELIQHALSATQKSAQTATLHALTSVFRAAPEGTYRALRAAASRSIEHLSHIKVLEWDDDSMKLNQELLSHILYICQEKPMLLAYASLGSLLATVSSLVQGSQCKCTRTSTETFEKLVLIVSALIRNRRDLLLSALPHLAVILGHMMKQFAAVQPNLGQRQRQIVSNKLAPWVVLDQPLGPTEATAFARLLVSLKSKTITRTKFQIPMGPNDSNPEAQSLAKPFGKHAASVLLAYLDLVTDQLCLVGRAVRAELAPGLYVLCETTGDRGRDALMAGLDQEKSAVLKTLWAAYEKQRYVGQG